MAGSTEYIELIDKLAEVVDSVDAIMAGVGGNTAVTSSSFRNESDEKRWASLAIHYHHLETVPVGQTYESLGSIVEGKRFHVVTTDQDVRLVRQFGEEHLSYIHGDERFFQCAKQCHDELYPAGDIVSPLYDSIKDDEIPTELVPRCPKCGADMEPWVYGYHFLEGERYRAEYGKWEDFVLGSQQDKVLFMEIGVRSRYRELIRQPFFHFAMGFPGSWYVNINPENTVVPFELEDHAFAIPFEVARVLADTANRLGR